MRYVDTRFNLEKSLKASINHRKTWLSFKISSFLGQKPHECHKCGKRFALGCNMKAHLKTHDPNRNKDIKEEPEEELDDIIEDEEMLNVTD